MIVFRIEKEGRGPYRDPNKFKKYAELCSDHAGLSHPTVYEDCIPDYYGLNQRFCAFESLDQLTNWFSEYWINELEAEGFNINCYEVPSEFVRFGRRQVVFDKEYAKLVETLTVRKK